MDEGPKSFSLAAEVVIVYSVEVEHVNEVL